MANFCDKPDRQNAKLKCGYSLPCPWHTVIIDSAGPRVLIPEPLGLSQKQRRIIREAAIRISDALED